MKTVLAVAMVVATALVTATAGHAGLGATGVITGHANTFAPAIDYTYTSGEIDQTIETWTRLKRGHGSAMFRIVGSPSLKMNSKGDGWTSGLDAAGGLAAFQQATRKHSNVRFYDWVNIRTSGAGSVVNRPRAWQYSPSINGTNLTFVRLNYRARPDRRTVYLYDTQTQRLKRLARLKSSFRNGDVFNGELRGDWADWNIGSHHRTVWNIYRHQISTGHTQRVPRPRGKVDYAPSIADDGTAYFVRSNVGCGKKPHLMSYSAAGNLADLGRFTRGYDVSDTFVSSTAADGSYDVFFDIAKCTRQGRSQGQFDIYKVHVMPPVTGNAGASAIARQLARIGGRPGRSLDTRPLWVGAGRGDHR